ncbi:MAG TPA: hypothetical protein VE977_01530, partial [Pyrinomonadaceae bacterium]|nr:hypothetical protein [Pyrinomonadaceae bacterium]
MSSFKRNTFSGSTPVITVLILLIVTVASSQAIAASPKLTSEDQQFLEDLEHRSFQYFWEEGDPNTGLVPDRARIDGSPLDENHRNVASIAATGFGLTGLSIAADRNWISRSQAQERTRNTLRFFANKAFHQHGWFYHWLDAKTG